MELPKAILEKNPIFQFGMDKGMRQGMRQGEHRGRQKEAAALVLRQLARKVGSVTPAQEAAIRDLPLAEIEALGEALLDFRKQSDLARWLESHSG
jgi:predicted transposase YdaD